jgi:hypothetical protein
MILLMAGLVFARKSGLSSARAKQSLPERGTGYARDTRFAGSVETDQSTD